MANELITVKDAVRDSLLMFPTIFKNALDVYDHLFCTNGNGYEWVDGCLVHNGYKPGDKITVHTIKDAVLETLDHRTDDCYTRNSVEASLMVSGIRAGAVVSDGVLNDAKNMLVRRIGSWFRDIREEIELCYRIDERCGDFGVPSESGKYSDRIYKIHDYKWKIYPLCRYAMICNIPDDVQDDWLEACKFMLEFIKNNPEYTNDTDAEWIPVIEKRIAELSNK